MEDSYFKLENITAYEIASELSDYVWRIVNGWDNLANLQLAANLSEL